MAGRPRPTHCESCGGLPGKKGIVFDHCHNRGHFRGWICDRCNKILGLALDDADRLLSLVSYLENDKKNILEVSPEVRDAISAVMKIR
jgi:hypothetical protein